MGRRVALGIVLGVGGGLFVDTLLVLLAGPALIYFVVLSVGLVVIAPPVAGAVLGVRWARARRRSAPGWWAIIALALLAWPAAVALPVGARALQLSLAAAATVPVYPGARRLGREVHVVGDSAIGPNVRLVYLVPAPAADIIAFYRRSLGETGWVDAGRLTEHRFAGMPWWFMRRARPLGGPGPLLALKVAPVAAPTPAQRVTVIYDP